MSDGVAGTARRKLRLRWTGLAILCFLLALAGYLILSAWWSMDHGRRWVAAAGGVFCYELVVLGRFLDRNRRTEAAQLHGSLGTANLVTLGRGVLLALLAGFAVVPQPDGSATWLPAGLYASAVILDQADGALARFNGRTTLLGARLDAEFDGLGLLVAGAVGVAYGVLPPWFLAVGLARFVYAGALRLERAKGKELRDLPGDRFRRPLAGTQMLVAATALSPLLDPPLTTIIATIAAIPFLARFFMDWLVVTGRW